MKIFCVSGLCPHCMERPIVEPSGQCGFCGAIRQHICSELANQIEFYTRPFPAQFLSNNWSNGGGI
jgi:hypothetical protein